VPAPEEEVRATLATFNCIGCHRRGDWGGIAESRNDYYLTEDPNLGETGRIPPPLTGVGAKIQHEWMRTTLAGGQNLRLYMSMRMPGFGADNVGHLADLFAQLDEVPAASFDPLPKSRQEANAIRGIGRELVGDKGMSCITCHTFRGRGSGTMAALDIVEKTGERLRPEWFHYYLLEPVRYRPDTIMPHFFPDGESIFPKIADGDTRRQIAAIWYYLAEGRNTGAPRGLRRPSMEIVVGDETVMLRRAVHDTGKRGISVGYPLHVSLTFDAEAVCMNQIWRGRFVDPGGVWLGQGSGRAGILSRDRIRLGKGPPFAELRDATTPWPTATSRELGIRFKGYELDNARRPTFLYVWGDMRIVDKPVDRSDERVGGGYIERTLTLRGSGDRTVWFRVAVGTDLEEVDDGKVAIDKRITVSAARRSDDASSRPVACRIRASAKDREVIVPLEIRNGEATLVLEYRWLKEPE